MQNLLEDLKGWARKPYDENATIFGWVLFIGIWVAATYLWSTVIKRLTD